MLVSWTKRSLSNSLPPAKATVLLEGLFAVAMRQLYLLTPMCSKDSDLHGTVKFERGPFLEVIREMVKALVDKKDLTEAEELKA